MALGYYVRVRISDRHEQALRAMARFYGAGPSETVRNALRDMALHLGVWPSTGEPETAGDNGQEGRQDAK